MTDADPLAATWQAVRRSTDHPLHLVAGDAVPWWSATFAGHLVTLTLAAPPRADLAHWLSRLPEIDLPIPNRLVADCAVERVAEADGATHVDLALLVLDGA